MSLNPPPAKLISALDEEISSLAADLENDPRYVKLRELSRVRSLYFPSPATVTVADHIRRNLGRPAVPTAAESLTGFSGADRKRRETSPQRAAALNEARKFLLSRTGPTKTSEIFDVLEMLDIEIGGNDPKSNLSAMLSYSDDFVSHGRSGWTLKKNEAPAALAAEPHESLSTGDQTGAD